MSSVIGDEIMTPKKIKKLIADEMNNRKTGVSVSLGEIDGNFDRILIKYPFTSDGISLNPITEILKKHNFYVAQILDWWDDNKRVILLCRGYK